MRKIAIIILGVQVVVVACGMLYDGYNYLFVPNYVDPRLVMRGIVNPPRSMFLEMCIMGKEVPYPVIGLIVLANCCCLVALLLNETERPNKSIQRRP